MVLTMSAANTTSSPSGRVHHLGRPHPELHGQKGGDKQR
jgi:hypothetical protein